MKNQTNSYKIARYILLGAIILVCGGVIIWTMIGAHRDMDAEEKVSRQVAKYTPCQQNVINAVSQVWAYSPQSVPQKYLDIADNYANETITVRTDGACNDIRFVCRVGQIRRDCDPCAVATGRQIAMQQQISDMMVASCEGDPD